MLSTESQGQMWGVQFSDAIKSNVMWLPEHSLPRDAFNTNLKSVASPILLIIEGPVFGPSGIAQVSFRHARLLQTYTSTYCTMGTFAIHSLVCNQSFPERFHSRESAHEVLVEGAR